MVYSGYTTMTNFVQRHYNPVVTFVLLGMCTGAFLMHVFLSVEARNTVESQEVAPSHSFSVMSPSEPVTLRIPAINLSVPFEGPLGVTAGQHIEVPDSFDAVGWYRFGPTPGELGPAVVLGHVDSYTGPAVFWSLKDLAVGDVIHVDREDGTTASFLVTRIEAHKQDGFPTERVYGDLDHAGLRLITCAGTYNQNTLQYSHNLIVFAKLRE